MATDQFLGDKACPFIRVAPRPPKPRDRGLTVLADKNLGMNACADLMETVADYVDFAKFGTGVFRIQSPEFLTRKIEFYHRHDVRVWIAGDATEMAFCQGVSDQLYKAVKAMGSDGVEVSSAQVSMTLANKCELIRMAAGEGLLVVAEVGQKGNETWTRYQSYIFSQIEACMKAGAWRVLVQGEGISEDVEARKEELILNIVARFGVDDLIFQAKDSDTQQWFMETLGNDVSLDVESHQVFELELMRRGIRKRGVFGIVGSVPST